MSRGSYLPLLQTLLGAGFLLAMTMKSWRLRPARRHPAPAKGSRATSHEMRDLLRLPAIALAAAPAGGAPTDGAARGHRHEVSAATMAGLNQPIGRRYSVYLMLASVAGLIALGVMYAAITGGTRTNHGLLVEGRAPSGSSGHAGGVSAAESPSVAQQWMDAKRKIDLGAASDALNSYASFTGGYPSTWGVLMPLCSNLGDRGCAVLVAHGPGLHASDGILPYWYASDGRHYTLLAQSATWPEAANCPGELPGELIGVPVFCVSGSLGR